MSETIVPFPQSERLTGRINSGGKAKLAAWNAGWNAPPGGRAFLDSLN